MIRFFKKSLNIQIVSLLVLIMAVAFSTLCLVIPGRQEALLTDMKNNVSAKLSEASQVSQAQFSLLEKDVTASFPSMNEQVIAHGKAIAGLVDEVATNSPMKNDYTLISEISGSSSTTKEITFILFLDKDNNPLPSFINRVDDRIVKYLHDFQTGDDGSRDEQLQEMNFIKIPDLFPWSDMFACGLRDIDRQHQRLVTLINALHRAMKLKTGSVEAGRILDELVDYTAEHFVFEEQLFDQHSYREAAEHRQLHEKLVGSVGTFQKYFKSGKAGLSI